MAATWTDERIEDVKKLWLNGMSASQIASLMGDGFTRNSVIGKVHRLGLKRDVANDPDVLPPAQSVVETPVAAKPEPISAPVVEPVSAETEEDEVLVLDTPGEVTGATEVTIPESKRVTIMDLKSTSCRWPMGDPQSPNFSFCGERAITGKPYCTHHHSIAFQAPSRSAIRVPRAA